MYDMELYNPYSPYDDEDDDYTDVEVYEAPKPSRRRRASNPRVEESPMSGTALMLLALAALGGFAVYQHNKTGKWFWENSSKQAIDRKLKQMLARQDFDDKKWRDSMESVYFISPREPSGPKKIWEP